jgi:hypothetical protein
MMERLLERENTIISVRRIACIVRRVTTSTLRTEELFLNVKITQK